MTESLQKISTPCIFLSESGGKSNEMEESKNFHCPKFPKIVIMYSLFELNESRGPDTVLANSDTNTDHQSKRDFNVAVL